MISASGAHEHGADIDHHIQSASKAFYANRWLLCDKNVSITDRLEYFRAVVSAVACFGAGARTVYKGDLKRLDVQFRKLGRQVVGPPGGIDWSLPWHETLHAWHVRLDGILDNIGMNTWSTECLQQYWRLAGYIANLPTDRWVSRVIAWQPHGRRPVGRPRFAWDEKLRCFCRWKGLGEWKLLAQSDLKQWHSYTVDFISFCNSSDEQLP